MVNKNDLLPRERLKKFGIKSLSDNDLISIVIGSGCKGHSVTSLSKEVLSLINSEIEENSGRLNSRSSFLSWKAFSEIKGLGDVKAMQIYSCLEFARRIYEKADYKVVLNSRSEVKSFLRPLKKNQREHVIVLCLDSQNQLLKQKTIAVGILNKVAVEPRDILYEVLKVGASGYILVHNHPSGKTDPSKADIVFTERMKKASEIIGVKLIDHVII